MALPTQRADDADVFLGHFAVLREFAEAIFVEGEFLDYEKQAECDKRVADFLEVGAR